MEINWQTLGARLFQTPVAAPRFRPESHYLASVETRVPADRYFWDGLKRSGSATRPMVVFQVTLDGQGIYETHGYKTELPPGRAFAAVVPSAHRYYLPSDSPLWAFFWLVIHHPYVVARIADRQRTGASPVLAVSPESEVVQRAAELVTAEYSDNYAEELALFAFLMAYERHTQAVVAAGLEGPAEQWREEARRFVRERLPRPVDVSEMASVYGMSRTRFSHRFREITGEAPAHFMTRIRLEEAARQLALSDSPLEAIARSTGFADANHLCKAFRRHYQTSPGAYRKQLR